MYPGYMRFYASHTTAILHNMDKVKTGRKSII